MSDTQSRDEKSMTVGQLLDRGDLVAAARREADAAEREGFDVTADLLRQLADAVQGKSHDDPTKSAPGSLQRRYRAWRLRLARAGITRSKKRIQGMKPYVHDRWARGWLREYERQLAHYEDKLASLEGPACR